MDLSTVLPDRAASDILAGRTRIILGGQGYDLPALSIAQSDAWLASMDTSLASLLGSLSDAGDDLPTILAILQGAPDQLLDLLYSYDRSGVLPDRDSLVALATKSELLRAVLGVWQTENPFVGLAMAGWTAGPLTSASLPPTNGSPPATAGRRRRSGGH